jgi:hypothetical protein
MVKQAKWAQMVLTMFALHLLALNTGSHFSLLAATWWWLAAALQIEASHNVCVPVLVGDGVLQVGSHLAMVMT